jgi:DNA-binding response OmpR family regulator
MSPQKILLVEDEARIAVVLKTGLTENGYAVEIAPDASAALKMNDTDQFDLVLLDVNLPGINGYEFCRVLRDNRSEVPVIMLTAMSGLEDKIEGYDAGADDYMIKPFEFRELLMKIRALLKRAASKVYAPRNVLKAGDLELNLDSKESSRAGTPITLTAKEFQLLEYLMRNKNKVVSRAEIAVNVWDIDFDTNTNIIDVYINYLRNKVDKPFEKKLIQTQVGMGYILKDN